MTRFWKSVVGLFCLCCYSSLKSDGLDLFSRLYLSNKGYAKSIEVKAYLVTRDQVINVLKDDNFEIIQKRNSELHDQEVFLLIRCKNFGDYRAFGTLNCKILNVGLPLSIKVKMLPGYMESFYDSAIMQIDSETIPNNNDIPVVTYKWKHLYMI
ncbi:MAG TPA: hypothetical protein PKW79_03110 [Rhabdochlamydiaceae bacterium]|nr:hypothetical protein [Rhabdochlamydiaceae bacterium]